MRTAALVVIGGLAMLTATFGTRHMLALVPADRALAAVFVNDSNVVEFVGTGENPPPVSGAGSTPPPPNTSHATPSDTQNLGNNADEESASDADAAAVPVSNAVETVTVSSNPSGGGGSTNTASNAVTEEVVSVDEIFTALIGNQAITGLDVVATGAGGNGSTLSLFGDRIREAFRARGIARIDIPSQSVLLSEKRVSGGVFSRSDFALFVSSAILADEHIGQVTYLSGKLSVTYKAFARLFGFVPVHYTLRTEAVFSNGTLTSLKLRFPWYSFFLAKGITEKGFTERMRSAILNEIDGYVSEYDVATHAFVAAGNALSLAVGAL